jgi:hypothetical protein
MKDETRVRLCSIAGGAAAIPLILGFFLLVEALNKFWKQANND